MLSEDILFRRKSIEKKSVLDKNLCNEQLNVKPALVQFVEAVNDVI